jgi:hypothetical protein
MRITIESRGGIEKLATVPFAPRTALISITDVDFDYAELKHQPDYLHQLKFDDVGYDLFDDFLDRKPTEKEAQQLAQEHHMFSPTQANRIAGFVRSIIGKVDTLICNCEYGQSRSAGVAAAVRQYLYEDGIKVFADERYYPNKVVYNGVYAALCVDKETRYNKRFDFFIGVADRENDILNKHTITRAQAKAVLILLGLNVFQNKQDGSITVDENINRFSRIISPFGVPYNEYHGQVYCGYLGKDVKKGTDVDYDKNNEFFIVGEDDELDRWGVLHLVIEGLKAYNAEHYIEWSKPYSKLLLSEANLGAEIWMRYCTKIIEKVDELP